MFSINQVAFVIFLDACAEAVRLHSVGTHPIYPHLVVLSFTLVAAWTRWRDWCARATQKRQAVFDELSVNSEVKPKTIVGFFHPYCNAGGGGEVVLWTAVAYLQRTELDVVCAVYTGDKDASKEEIIAKAKTRFDIDLDPKSLTFVWLENRAKVDAKSWPKFTLLGQSFGSVILAIEAIDHLVPDIFIDTMGYAFTFPLLSALSLVLRRIPSGGYVHYPTISTDMLQRVKSRQAGHTNEAAVAGSWWKSLAKLQYYRAFAFLYSFSLLQADELTVNSSWTKNHVDSLIASARRWLPSKSHSSEGVEIVYPPCNMDRLQNFPLEGRERIVLSVAQFRPEKEHATQIRAMHRFLEEYPECQAGKEKVQLVLVGGCRSEGDEKRVANLKRLVKDLEIENNVGFVVNASYDTLLEWLSKSSVGISTMVDEHFGINVVEYMASGLIPLVHESGGPLNDIVIPTALDEPTGYHASSMELYSEALAKIFVQDKEEDLLAMRKRARDSAVERFGRTQFEEGWASFWGALRSKWEGYKKHV